MVGMEEDMCFNKEKLQTKCALEMTLFNMCLVGFFSMQFLSRQFASVGACYPQCLAG